MSLLGTLDFILEAPILLLASAAACAYVVVGAIYRLHFSPVATFPGPRLAALTYWYEFYYDVIRKGSYTWRIQDLHDKYGPVVRINPQEIHVNDAAFYDSVYVGSSRRTEKWNYSARMFGTSLAAVGTTGHDLHRLRRSGLNVFFSKRSISKLEPTVQKVVDEASARLESCGAACHVLNLRDFFAAFSADVIGEVAFGSRYGLLHKEDFEPGWQRLMMDLSRATHLMKQFPWAYGILNSIPQTAVSLLHPLTKRLFDIRNDIRLRVEQTRLAVSGISSKVHTASYLGAVDHPTVLHSLLTVTNLPSPELETPRLEDEAFTLLGAGTITTAHTLTTILYHILSKATIKSRLEDELSQLGLATADDSSKSKWTQLEKAPYLAAIVSEGLRLSFGVSHRLPRISPDTALHFNGKLNEKEYEYTIPPGVPVSMTSMFIHLDPTIYTSPQDFDPARWLTSPNDSEERQAQLQRMKHYLVPFSRGTRICVGMNLAYAEFYLMLGALFSPDGVGTRMELFETGKEDVECMHDFFNPSPRLDSKGVRVVLKTT
ncbi:cytochrome P450 [Massariosphaeria phaeospora]|uniref:Cytochrome P450 n=1 Tax=Massariosphaeria phaeospora TaxID=100035 RepID=A0A7C8M908_9PLEO|nr:cytochrome P450 [Massariosphaeria phaeospora]